MTRNNGTYEAQVDGQVAGTIVFQERDGSVVMTHTEVVDEGHGTGSELVRQALDDVRSRGLTVVPQCPFVAAWIDRHDDYADLVAR